MVPFPLGEPFCALSAHWYDFTVKGIRIESGAKVTAVTEDSITFEKDGAEYVIRDADTLVFANGYHVDSAMEDMLKAAGAVCHLIGDGAKVGNIKDAISGAYEIARAL